MSHRSFRRAALKEQAGSGRALTFVSVPWTARPSLLLGQPKAVAFPRLLAGQRRAEIGVAIADDRARPVGGSWVQATVAGFDRGPGLSDHVHAAGRPAGEPAASSIPVVPPHAMA